MIYYTVTNYYDHDRLMNSLSKGRDDYFEMLGRMGMERILIPTFRPKRFLSLTERIRYERSLSSAWTKSLKKLGPGDTLVIHSPNSEKFLSFARIIKDVKRRGCRVVTIVFELEMFLVSDYARFAEIKRRVARETEKMLFSISDAVVVHNDVMKQRLVSAGVDAGKMFSVGVMDYLRDGELNDEATDRIGLGKPVAFAGALNYEKSRFEYDLPEGFRCNLYGADYTGRESEFVKYKGVFDPLELMDIMEGSFGLVWDGDSCDGCTGQWGDYLTFNNPHKIALYMASGMPVIVWEKAAMAHFVRKEGCGLIVNSLRDVPGLIGSMTDKEYEEMRLNACRVGREMRQGLHIRSAVEEALAYLEK